MTVQMAITDGYPCTRCGVWVGWGVHSCGSMPPYQVTGGYTCTGCGSWVSFGLPHTCPLTNSWTCAGCGQVVNGFHICHGQAVFMPVAAPEPEPAKVPETPLAGLAAKLAGLITQAQDWLAERKL